MSVCASEMMMVERGMIKHGCVRVFSVDLDKHAVTDKMTEARM